MTGSKVSRKNIAAMGISKDRSSVHCISRARSRWLDDSYIPSSVSSATSVTFEGLLARVYVGWSVDNVQGWESLVPYAYDVAGGV